MFERVDPSLLDFRFSDECPNCGRVAGWSGLVQREDGRVFLGLACPHCGNRFLDFSPAWQARFDAAPPPSHRPGAKAQPG